MEKKYLKFTHHPSFSAVETLLVYLPFHRYPPLQKNAKGKKEKLI